MPPDASNYQPPGGPMFWAPDGVDWSAISMAGQSNGAYNFIAGNGAIGQFGIFDFQREDADLLLFYSQYVNASNYGAGIYMNGAGYSLLQTILVAEAFSYSMSSNASGDTQLFWIVIGWYDASTGQYAQKVGDPSAETPQQPPCDSKPGL